MVLQMLRDGSLTSVKVSPVQTGEEEYKVGLWVRDDTQGIGTLTYVDEEGNFGALGHGISDVDTNGILSIKEGTLYNADILSITKGERGAPGELLQRHSLSGGWRAWNDPSKSGYGNLWNADLFSVRIPKGGSHAEVGLKQEIQVWSSPGSVRLGRNCEGLRR